MFFARTLVHALPLLILSVTAGCGYASVRGRASLGAEHLLVLPPREAQPTGIAGQLTEELRRQLASDGVALTVDRSRADAILDGTVSTVSTSPLATVSGARLSAFTVRVSYDATLVAADGDVLWSGRFSEQEDFFAEDNTSEGILATEGNRRRALYRLTERLAAQVMMGLRQASL